jgi:hypothetical protein
VIACRDRVRARVREARRGWRVRRVVVSVGRSNEWRRRLGQESKLGQAKGRNRGVEMNGRDLDGGCEGSVRPRAAREGGRCEGVGCEGEGEGEGPRGPRVATAGGGHL